MTILQILQERDGLTRGEAEDLLSDVREEINDVLASGGSYDEIEDIMLSDLGLEMDYIHEVLG